MTYEKFKEIVVKENGILTEKQVKRLVTKLFITILLLGFDLLLLVSTVINMAVGVLVLILCILLFLWLFDLSAESEGGLKFTRVFSNFWILFLLLFIAEVLILSYLSFL